MDKTFTNIRFNTKKTYKVEKQIKINFLLIMKTQVTKKYIIPL